MPQFQLLASALFLLCLIFLAYTIAGYPLLLAWLARRIPQPRPPAFQPLSVSAIVPVHNGAAFLGPKLDSLLALDFPADLLDILVVSDGSTDATAEVARSYADRRVRLLEVPKGGKPAALNAAAPHCHGEILLLTDVRQVLDPQCLRNLVARFADPKIGTVSGDLLLRSGTDEQNNVGLYWRYERSIRKNLAAVDSMLGATGPIYALRRALFVPIPPNCLLDDMYLPLAGAFFRGYRLALEPSALAYDVPTGVTTEFGRKVRTLAGNYQLFWMLPALWSPSNRMFGHYLSLKIFRLLLPWAFLLLFLTSFWLPSPLPLIVLPPQLAFLAAAILDPWIPAPFNRISSPARTVAAMLAASACAVAIFWIPPQKFWKPTNLFVDPHPQTK